MNTLIIDMSKATSVSGSSYTFDYNVRSSILEAEFAIVKNLLYDNTLYKSIPLGINTALPAPATLPCFIFRPGTQAAVNISVAVTGNVVTVGT